MRASCGISDKVYLGAAVACRGQGITMIPNCKITLICKSTKDLQGFPSSTVLNQYNAKTPNSSVLC